MNNYETAREAIQNFTVGEIQSFVSELSRVAREKHSAHMPWMIWSREDFDPGEEFRGEDRDKVMDESWTRALNNKNFMDCLDYDWERIRMISDEVLYDLDIRKYFEEVAHTTFKKRYDEVVPGEIIKTPSDGWRVVEVVDVDPEEGVTWIGFTDGQDSFGSEFQVEVMRELGTTEDTEEN